MFSFETTSASEHHNFGRISCLVKNHNFHPLYHWSAYRLSCILVTGHTYVQRDNGCYHVHSCIALLMTAFGDLLSQPFLALVISHIQVVFPWIRPKGDTLSRWVDSAPPGRLAQTFQQYWDVCLSEWGNGPSLMSAGPAWAASWQENFQYIRKARDLFNTSTSNKSPTLTGILLPRQQKHLFCSKRRSSLWTPTKELAAALMGCRHSTSPGNIIPSPSSDFPVPIQGRWDLDSCMVQVRPISNLFQVSESPQYRWHRSRWHLPLKTAPLITPTASP